MAVAVYTWEHADTHTHTHQSLTLNTDSILVTYLTSNDVIVMSLMSIIITTPFSGSLQMRLHHHDIMHADITSRKKFAIYSKLHTSILTVQVIVMKFVMFQEIVISVYRITSIIVSQSIRNLRFSKLVESVE